MTGRERISINEQRTRRSRLVAQLDGRTEAIEYTSDAAANAMFPKAGGTTETKMKVSKVILTAGERADITERVRLIDEFLVSMEITDPTYKPSTSPTGAKASWAD